MKWFNNASIRIKLILIMALTAMLALLLATTAVVINEYFSKKHDTEKQLALISDIISWNAAASLTFRDVRTAQDMLQGTKSQPSLLAAQLYDAKGQLFADFHAPKDVSNSWPAEALLKIITHTEQNPQSNFAIQPPTPEIKIWLDKLFNSNMRTESSKLYKQAFLYDENNILHLFRPIILDGELQGILHLADDQSSLQILLQRFYIIISIIIIVTCLSILYISTKLQKVFLAPLLELMEAMRTVTLEKNFSRKISKIAADEFGEMAKVYNTMLTEIQERDEELTQHRDHLEQQVISRTHELSQINQNLELAVTDAIVAKELAEAASKAKSQFLATMSHEIRTPMNGVLGMTELLMNSKLSHRQKHLAETAYRCAESLLSIINNILDFSKIEASKFQLNLHDFNLRDLLEDTAEMLASQAHNKNLELALNLPVNLSAIIIGDAERLRQILINLLGNAIKFTHEGEVQLKVSLLAPETDTHTHLLFEIIDTGPGIPSGMQTAIFESFTQVDGSITRRFGGTGLGLTISKQLVELMGGNLEVNSTIGHGSCFYFKLKFENSARQISAKAEISKLKDINVLVVDDNLTNREILNNQLSYWGANCTCVVSGAQALEHLHHAFSLNKTYQVMILDWHMPEMDGLTLAKTIINNPRFKNIGLIMLSSDNLAYGEDKNESFGASFFLTKPVIQQKLLDCLLEILGESPIQTKTLRTVFPPANLSCGALILLAEDQVINQEVGKYMLKDLGYQVEIAKNGLEAVQACEEKCFDLILMDCHMPEMDGFEATTIIRARELASSKPRVPIIALTADIQIGIDQQCLESGMDSYLSKPFSQNQLQNILSLWLTKTPASSKETKEVSNIEYTHPCSENLATSSEIDEYLLNLSTLENLKHITTENDENLFNKAVRLFADSAPESLNQVWKALANANSGELRQAIHGLKSVSANLGAESFSACCAEIEIFALQGDLDKISGLICQLEDMLPKVMTTLTKQLVSTIQPDLTLHAELHPVSILLVDDDEDFRFITRQALLASGFKVDEAESGAQALEKINQFLPDLVLLDAVMTGMDGFTVCRAMRSISKMTDIPIIMSTGLGDMDSINLAFAAGANDFVIKPLNYQILAHRLWFIIRASQNISELRTSKIQLSSAQRIARLGYWTWHTNRDQFTISEYLAQMCGISIQSFANTLDAYLNLVHPEDRDPVRLAIETPSYEPIEYRILLSPSVSIFVSQVIEKLTENSLSVITGTVQDITHKKQAEWQMHQLAYFDNLTGLASRAYYHIRLEEFIRAANRREEQFAFMFIDLDGFKDINDSFGHNIGDEFLKAIAERLKLVIRDIDFAARLGGDEFCLILDSVADKERASEVADRCLQKINQPLQLNQFQIKPRASIGIAFYPQDGDNEVALMKAADAAMYAAKQAGKQCYMFYSEEMSNKTLSRLEKEQMLRDAFELNQFVMHYQPQISMQTGRLIAMEALVRWQHPQKGMIPPNDFIPMIENMGLINQLGNWALRNVCRQILQWREEGLPFLQVAVNIAPSHFHDPALFDTIKALLIETAIPANYLELEVTESAMQTEGCIQVFNQLRSLGIKIALDDFGTGYSCLASLKQLPLDYLKVDKIFVDDVLTNTHTSLLLGTIIGLANALDYTVVAEGVETKNQALVMHALGCQIVQGYLFSRPVSSDQIAELLNKNYTLQPENVSSIE